jgi:acetate kinase
MKILVLNSGSSSQKICLYQLGENLPDNPPGCLWEGAALPQFGRMILSHSREFRSFSPRHHRGAQQPVLEFVATLQFLKLEQYSAVWRRNTILVK